jgi:Type I restriction enzyme R protein N terminus (HSDR_N)
MDEREAATVIEGDAAATVADAAKKLKARSAPKWETEARDRLKAAIRRFSKPLAELVARDANEGDTRLLVTDFLCDGLGFDKYADLTTEYQVKGEFADYGLRIDRELVAFIEVKRVATKLSTRHLRQVEMYAVNEGVEWIILTNGSVWQVYHITGGLPMAVDLALEVNLLGEEPPAHKVNQLFYLSRESLKKRQIDDCGRPGGPPRRRPWPRCSSLTMSPRRSARNSGGRPVIGLTRSRSSGCSARRCFVPAAFKGRADAHQRETNSASLLGRRRITEARAARRNGDSTAFALA